MTKLAFSLPLPLKPLKAPLKLITSPFQDTVAVPRDLSHVTRIDRDSEVSAAEGGLESWQLEEIWRGVENLYASGVYPAVQFCLRRNGKILLNRSLGHARGNGPDKSSEPSVSLTPETPICLYSASKAVTAMVMHKLEELKEINLMDPVGHYIPEFKRSDKRGITVHQVLSHRAGIPLPPAHLDKDALFDPDLIKQAMREIEPEWPAGSVVAYHALTGGYIFAAIVEEVTGQSIQAFLQENFAEPLGMKYFTYGLPQQDKSELALNYNSGFKIPAPIKNALQKMLGASLEEVVEISNDERFYDQVIPAGNLVATAEEVSRFYQMLLDKGEYEGKTLLSPNTVYRAVQPVGKMEIDRLLLLPMRYSAGFMLGNDPYGMYGPKTKSAFGHLGFSNNFCWADPERNIAVSLLTTGNPVIGTHLPSLLKLLSSISSHCAPMREVDWIN